MPDKKEAALQLENAKDNLEAQIKKTVEEQEQPGEPERVNVRLGDDPETGGSDEGDTALISEIRALVDDFERGATVQTAGVTVRRVTALDSDADGEAAVDVEYDYDVQE